MAPSAKAADRRKSGAKPSLTVTLNVSPNRLRDIFSPPSSEKEDPSSPALDSKETKESHDTPEIKETPASPTAAPASSNSISNGDNATDSNAATPAAEGTPAPSVMGPPTEGAKKKGVKRSAATANGTIDGIPKPRGKPGPKKKPRLEDGTIDHSGAGPRPSGGHKLGPKANQGAINAGLRALDRSGKPCRKWAKGGFKLKSFTGVCWEIPRWTAPQKKNLESGAEDSAAPSAESSNKENKENGNEAQSAANSNSGVDVEMHSVASLHASSPAPMPIAAAS